MLGEDRKLLGVEMSSVAIRACTPWTQPISTKYYDQVWAINNAGKAYDFDPDLIIAMDDLQRDWDSGNHDEYVKAIVEAGCKVYSARKHKQWPNVEPYPLKEVLRKLKLDKNWWSVFDNSDINHTKIAAEAETGELEIYEEALWNSIKHQ